MLIVKMFRKPKNKKVTKIASVEIDQQEFQQGRFRRRSNEHDDEKEEENNNKNDVEKEGTSDEGIRKEETSCYDQINAVKKRRKLLTDLHYKRGTDATYLLLSSKDVTSKKNLFENNATEKEKQQQQQKHIAITGSVVMSNDTSQEGILQQKHMLAMNEYIESRLMKGTDSISNDNRNDNPENQNSNQTNGGGSSTIPTTATATKVNQDNFEDDDGAVVGVGGTGIEEVVLPIEHRFDTLKRNMIHATNTNHPNTTHNNNHANRTNQIRDPNSASNTTTDSKSILPSRPYLSKNGSVPNRFSTSALSSTQQHHLIQMQQQQKHHAVSASATEIADSNRIGFEAARRLLSSGSTTGVGSMHTPDRNSNVRTTNTKSNVGNTGNNNNNNNNRNGGSNTMASDDRIYQQFVSRQRERNHRK